MKKKMATLVALAMTTVMTLSMMACGGTTTPSSSEGGTPLQKKPKLLLPELKKQAWAAIS